MTHLETAQILAAQGIACIPVGKDKVPRLQSWRHFMTRVPSETEMTAWWPANEGIALVAGTVQCIDFDCKYQADIFSRYVLNGCEEGLGQLINTLLRQHTPSGGYHLVMKVGPLSAIGGNLKLATNAVGKTLIETRGNGGYFLIAPSDGYAVDSGDMASIPEVTFKEFNSLLDLARLFDESPERPKQIPEAKKHAFSDFQKTKNGPLTPGDDYNARGDVAALLRDCGWRHVGGHNWKHPTATNASSATWDYVPRHLVVFSPNAGFPDTRAYLPHAVYAFLCCNGDFARATSELRALGFGGERKFDIMADLIKDLNDHPDCGDEPTIEELEKQELARQADAAAHGEEHEPTEAEIEADIRRQEMFSRMVKAGINIDHYFDAKLSDKKPFTLWTASQFMAHEEDPSENLLGDGFICKGEWTTLIGVGGIGKSRLALWLCIRILLRKDFCGLPTSQGEPGKILFLSTENGIKRWKSDFKKMFSALSAEEKEIIDTYLYCLALTPGESGDLNLGSIDSCGRLGVTFKVFDPLLIVLDPFADMIDGDENKTEDMVKTLRTLRGLHRAAAPTAAVVIIHHGRSGTDNMAKAGNNFEAGGFGRGSKALYSRVRCEIDLSAGDMKDKSLIVMACGKSNNAEAFSTRGIKFDADTFAYEVDPSFDEDTWRDSMKEQKRESRIKFPKKELVELIRSIAPYAGAFVKRAEILKKVTLLELCSADMLKARLRECLDAEMLESDNDGGYSVK